MNEYQDLPDYVWHIKLSGDEEDSVHEDVLAEMLRRQLKALLGCVELTSNGESVKVTGFRLLADPDRDYAIYAISPGDQGPGVMDDPPSCLRSAG